MGHFRTGTLKGLEGLRGPEGYLCGLAETVGKTGLPCGVATECLAGLSLQHPKVMSCHYFNLKKLKRKSNVSC